MSTENRPSWIAQHANDFPGHRTRETLDHPGRCLTCGALAPAALLEVAATTPPPSLPGGSMLPAPGSVRPVEFGTCATVDCDRDAHLEVFVANDDGALWVPMCFTHLNSGPSDGLEYVVEVHGFVPAGAP